MLYFIRKISEHKHFDKKSGVAGYRARFSLEFIHPVFVEHLPLRNPATFLDAFDVCHARSNRNIQPAKVETHSLAR